MPTPGSRGNDRAQIVLLKGAVLALLAAVCVGGCGDARTVAPNLARPAPPAGFRSLGFREIVLRVPNNWRLASATAPLVATDSSGTAMIALWRYPTTAPPPVDPTALGQARDALLSAAKARDPGLEVIRTGLATIDGDGVVELDTLEQIDGQPRRVRSVHIYLPRAELVLEEYAPASIFHAVDHGVFSPVRRSLQLLTNRAK